MKIVKASAEILKRAQNESLAQRVERIGRVCYKSEAKITDGSAERFVRNLIASGHESVLEHADIALEVGSRAMIEVEADLRVMKYNGFENFLKTTHENRSIISGNIRAWRDFLNARGSVPWYCREMILENKLFFPEFDRWSVYDRANTKGEKVRQISTDELTEEIEKLKHKRITVRFICDRGVSHEIVRHRTASFSQESTRYCNYSKDAFGGEISVVEPLYLMDDPKAYAIWKTACSTAESAYFAMLNLGRSPQEARAVLPNSLKTELIMTTNLEGWKHFFDLRLSKSAHPQMREVAEIAYELLRAENPGIFD